MYFSCAVANVNTGSSLLMAVHCGWVTASLRGGMLPSLALNEAMFDALERSSTNLSASVLLGACVLTDQANPPDWFV